MLLSILIPTYNRKEKLESQLNFLRDSEKVLTYSEIEVLISNNNSVDDTEQYLNSIKDYGYKIFHQKCNLGIIGNFKFLINKSQGKYIWILGDDDILRPGIVKKVLQKLNNKKSFSHLFLNHSWRNNGIVTKQSVYIGDEKIYSSEHPFFIEVVEQTGFGVLMFISANIYRRDVVRQVNKILKKNGEEDNLALPLAYSIYASKYETTLINEVVLENDSTDISWSRQKTLVYGRDMLAAYNTVISLFPNVKELRDFYMKHQPAAFPEYRYFFFGHKYGKDNYALKFILKNYPKYLAIDIVLAIRSCIRFICFKLKGKV